MTERSSDARAQRAGGGVRAQPRVHDDAADASHDVDARRTRWPDAWRTLRRRPDTIVAAVILVFFLVVAVFPGLFTSADPQHCLITESKIRPQGFGETHPFGTDAFGCDMLAQLAYGARPSLLLAVVVVGASVLIGVVLGLVAGYYLGWVDAVISRSIEVFLVIPLLLAALLLLSLFRNVSVGSGTFNDILLPATVLTMFGWMAYARYVRASVLETKSLDYVTAARVLGASDLRVMFRHVLPNAIGPVTALDSDVDRRDHRRRGGARVPRHRRPTAGDLVGHHDQQRRRVGDRRLSLPAAVPARLPDRHRPVARGAGRRLARRTRPEAAVSSRPRHRCSRSTTRCWRSTTSPSSSVRATAWSPRSTGCRTA